MRKIAGKIARRQRRKFRVRKKISGTADRPRITVYKSNRRTYVQAIDDEKGVTIAAASNMEKELSKLKNDIEHMQKIGEALGAKLKGLKIEKAVFDRNGYIYHGKVKALADGIRKTGIQF